jgi:uncharacterized protein YfiM (DUF2279 family)
MTQWLANLDGRDRALFTRVALPASCPLRQRRFWLVITHAGGARASIGSCLVALLVPQVTLAIAWRGSRISVSAYYEDAEMSGGLQAEDLTQYGFDAYISHNVNSWCRVGAGYHYGNTDSSLKDTTTNLPRDFDQNAFSADLNFLISRKATLSLGYRYFTTDAVDPQFAFDQNRFVMALNYNF